MKNEDRPIRGYPIIDRDTHTHAFPAAPPPMPEVETFSRPPMKRSGPIVGTLLGFLLGATLGFLGGAWVGEAPPAPVVAQAPEAPPAVTLTQEQLDQKTERAAFFTGRGQPEGGAQILRDTITGTGCEVVEAQWGPFDDTKTAEAAASAFELAQPKDQLTSTAIVRAERPDLAGGKYVGTAVSLRCPQPEEVP